MLRQDFPDEGIAFYVIVVDDLCAWLLKADWKFHPTHWHFFEACAQVYWRYSVLEMRFHVKIMITGIKPALACRGRTLYNAFRFVNKCF